MLEFLGNHLMQLPTSPVTTSVVCPPIPRAIQYMGEGEADLIALEGRGHLFISLVQNRLHNVQRRKVLQK